MKAIDWVALAGQLGLLYENGESADRESALRAAELIIGEEALAAAVNFYVSFEPGAALAHYVLMLLRPSAAQCRCYEIYRSDPDPDSRRFALELFRDIADRRALPWIGEFLVEPDSKMNVYAVDLLDLLIRTERAMPQDVEDHLRKAEEHPNPEVRETAAALRQFINSDMGMSLSGPLKELIAEPQRELPVLLKSRGVTVARLFFEEADDRWVHYRFEPYPEWRDLGPVTDVFSKIPKKGAGKRRGEETGREIMEAKARAIAYLDLWLVSEDGSVVFGDFLLSLRDDRLLVSTYAREASSHVRT